MLQQPPFHHCTYVYWPTTKPELQQNLNTLIATNQTSYGEMISILFLSFRSYYGIIN